jgi:hypothetical protein
MRDEHGGGARRARLGVIEATYAFLFFVADNRGGAVKTPFLNAIASVSFLLFVNMLTMCETIVICRPVLREWFLSAPRIAVGGVAVSILIAIGLYFGRKGAHDLIMREYSSDEGWGEGGRYRTVAWTYILASLVALGILTFVLRAAH